ncbi:hypothetical protein L916_07093, partial [Phytophthora nicotianae]
MECEAQINDCVQVDDDKVPTFILHITFALLVHNHSLDKRTYNQYPYVRTALESEVETTVNELRKTGAKKNQVHSRKLRVQSVNTERAQYGAEVEKKESTAPTSAKRLKKGMVEFCEEPGNTIATCITLQTGHMRSLFDRFPEVLMIDATH